VELLCVEQKKKNKNPTRGGTPSVCARGTAPVGRNLTKRETGKRQTNRLQGKGERQNGAYKTRSNFGTQQKKIQKYAT